jgi:hypothetical protein
VLIFESQREARGQTRKLLLAFALTVVLLVLAVNAALALAWGLSWGFWVPVWGGLPRHFFAVNTGVTLVFVLGGWWIETSRLAGGGLALAEQMGARELRPSGDFDEQRFANIVDEMAIASGMKKPQAMVMARNLGINALATGGTRTTRWWRSRRRAGAPPVKNWGTGGARVQPHPRRRHPAQHVPWHGVWSGDGVPPGSAHLGP